MLLCDRLSGMGVSNSETAQPSNRDTTTSGSCYCNEEEELLLSFENLWIGKQPWELFRKSNNSSSSSSSRNFFFLWNKQSEWLCSLPSTTTENYVFGWCLSPTISILRWWGKEGGWSFFYHSKAPSYLSLQSHLSITRYTHNHYLCIYQFYDLFLYIIIASNAYLGPVLFCFLFELWDPNIFIFLWHSFFFLL